MSGWSLAAILLWLLVGLGSLGVWFTRWEPVRRQLIRTPVLIAITVAVPLLTGGVAGLAAHGPPTQAPGSWLAVGTAAFAALVSGGALTSAVLRLADASSRAGTARVQPTVLRGGAWIGALERLALLGTLLSGWPEGLAAIVAVKAFARYPELQAGQGTGAIERFIIGTFTSLGWAALCAGIVQLLI